MPLFMDFHRIPNITIEAARKAHIEDEKIQNNYGVKYLQFWVNQQAGNLFCLVEGPDKEKIEEVHRRAHGHVACAMVELNRSQYSLIMDDKNLRVEEGLVINEHGAVDLGYRTIMAVWLESSITGKKNQEGLLPALEKTRGLITQTLPRHQGRVIKLTGDDHILSVFNSTSQALKCANEIQASIIQQNKMRRNGSGKVSSFIGVASGQPLNENNEFIEETVRLATRLSQVAGTNEIVISQLAQELTEAGRKGKVRALNGMEETFLTALLQTIERHFADENFTIELLVREMGISRPQLYRKIQSLSGMAPNDLIRHLRLMKSMPLLRRKSGNISEVALSVGFSNPSYFAKCFAAKFGCSPSQFLATSRLTDR
jgi:AraC-like DNA-binding protein